MATGTPPISWSQRPPLSFGFHNAQLGFQAKLAAVNQEGRLLRLDLRLDLRRVVIKRRSRRSALSSIILSRNARLWNDRSWRKAAIELSKADRFGSRLLELPQNWLLKDRIEKARGGDEQHL
jgi:hypothetical protein